MSRARDAAKRKAFAEALLAWFERERRDLPWRRTRDPWAILVSEIILQQTRVETGLRYYGPFLRRFPTPRALAAADDDALMKAWEGLGYYRRARNLREAAKRIAALGRVPRTRADLEALPGVGPYTAGAVASIAFDEPEPCIDGNASRVYARLFAVRRDASTPGARREFQALARTLLPARSGAFNQAIMELGSRVCVPGEPRCGECPVARFCEARKRGLQRRLPRLPQRAKPRPVRVAVALAESPRGIVLARNPEGGLLGGLWTLPTVELNGARPPDALAAATGLASRDWVRSGRFRHTFSHREWRGSLYRLRLSRAPRLAAGLSWVPRARALQLALTTASRRLLAAAVL